ncbi:unnamed protein product, partial [marine sediment metagenome]
FIINSRGLNSFSIAKVAGFGLACYAAKHWLTQFHPSYTPKEKLERLTKEQGYDHWYQLFVANYAPPFLHYCKREPNIPALHSFVLIENKVGETLWERNPYYWKVDTQGNQLPYIDRVFSSAG